MLRHFLRNNDYYLPSYLSPFFHRLLASSFLPIRFLLPTHFYSSTMYFLLSPNHFSQLQYFELLLPRLHHSLHSNDLRLPMHLLPFFHRPLASSFLSTHLLQLSHGYRNTKHYLLLSNLVQLYSQQFDFELLLPTLHYFLHSNDLRLPMHLLPFFHQPLASSFLPMHFLLMFHFDYKDTKHYHFSPSLVLLEHHYLLLH